MPASEFLHLKPPTFSNMSGNQYQDPTHKASKRQYGPEVLPIRTKKIKHEDTGANSASNQPWTLKDYENDISNYEASGNRADLEDFLTHNIMRVQSRAGEDDFPQIMGLLKKKGRECGFDFGCIPTNLKTAYDGPESFEVLTFWLQDCLDRREQLNVKSLRELYRRRRSLLEKLLESSSGNRKKYLEKLKSEFEKVFMPPVSAKVAAKDKPAHVISLMEKDVADITQITCKIFEGEDDIRELWIKRRRLMGSVRDRKKDKYLLNGIRSGTLDGKLKKRLEETERERKSVIHQKYEEFSQIPRIKDLVNKLGISQVESRKRKNDGQERDYSDALREFDTARRDFVKENKELMSEIETVKEKLKAAGGVPCVELKLEETAMDIDDSELDFCELAHWVSLRKVAFYGVNSFYQTRAWTGMQRVIIRLGLCMPLSLMRTDLSIQAGIQSF